MAKIVSKRGREETKAPDEVNFEIQLISDEELDELLEKQAAANASVQQEFEYYSEDWVIQGRQAFEGLRMVEDIQAMQQDWDCCYNYQIEVFTIRTPRNMVSLTELFIQSLTVPIREFLDGTMKP